MFSAILSLCVVVQIRIEDTFDQDVARNENYLMVTAHFGSNDEFLNIVKTQCLRDNVQENSKREKVMNGSLRNRTLWSRI